MPGFASEPLFLRHASEIADGLGRVLGTGDSIVSNATQTQHGTGGNLTNRIEANNNAAATADTIPAWGGAFAAHGWRIDPADLGTSDSRVAVTIPSGAWSFQWPRLATVEQLSAQTTLTVRVGKRDSGGAITELFRKASAPYATGTIISVGTMTFDATTTIGSGLTGLPPAITLANGETLQFEFYVTAPGVAVVGQTLTFQIGSQEPERVASFDLPGLTSIVTEPAATNTSVVAPTQKEVLSEPPTTLSSAAVHTALASLAELSTVTSASVHTQAGAALAQIQEIQSVASLTRTETLRELAAVVTSIASLSSLQALSDSGGITSASVLAATDALAEAGLVTSVVLPSANWQRVSPGLSGVAYDATGSTPVSGVQVLVFRNDNHALIANLTTDGSGSWATNLDPAFKYWISYWIGDGSPTAVHPDNRGWRTDRFIPTVETVVETGT